MDTFDVGRYSSVTIGADGLPIISYYDDGNGHLKVAHCGDPACSNLDNNTLTTVDDSSDAVGYGSSITIGVDGLPIISYLKDAYYLRAAHCGDSTCSDRTTNILSSLTAIKGVATSITIGAEGLPIISFIGQSYLFLLVQCGGLACSDGFNSYGIIDPVNDPETGLASSTIGVDGLPVISYFAVSNDNLKVAHCGEPDCSAGIIRTDVDAGLGNAGGYPSITIGADGLPIISYVDGTNNSLKVAHCSN